MRRLTIGLVVVGLLLVCSQAFSEQDSYAVEAGGKLGYFSCGYNDIVVLCREPANQQQLVRVLVTYSYFAHAGAEDVYVGPEEVIASMSPLIRFDSGPAFPYEKIGLLANVDFHETQGWILVLSYPSGTGNCTLEVNTSDGTFSLDLGLADQKCYLSYRVASYAKVNLLAEPSTQAKILRTLFAGDIICPTGAVETPATEEELLFFEQMITPEGDMGWVLWGKGLYLENGYYSCLTSSPMMNLWFNSYPPGVRTLTDWHILPPTSEWKFWTSSYLDNGEYMEEYIVYGTYVFTYTAPGESKWHTVEVDMGNRKGDRCSFFYEDDDYDGLWTERIVYR